MYRTTSAFGCVVDKDEAETGLKVIQQQNEKAEFDHERQMMNLQITDSGESHDGLVVCVQVYAENSESAKEWWEKTGSRASWLDICSIHLSKRQVHELIDALKNALSMRKYDDEVKENA